MALRLIALTLLSFLLSACIAEKSYYGVPPLTWKNLTPEQQKLIAKQSQSTVRKSHEV